MTSQPHPFRGLMAKTICAPTLLAPATPEINCAWLLIMSMSQEQNPVMPMALADKSSFTCSSCTEKHALLQRAYRDKKEQLRPMLERKEQYNAVYACIVK